MEGGASPSGLFLGSSHPILGPPFGLSWSSFRLTPHSPQDRAMWHSLVALLQAQGQLPAVAFTFSRGRCDAHAAALGRTDLSSAAEKGRVRGFVRRCLARLRGGDRRLPQVGALGGCYRAVRLS